MYGCGQPQTRNSKYHAPGAVLCQSIRRCGGWLCIDYEAPGDKEWNLIKLIIMGSFIDLTNKTFGRLTVISISHKGSHGVWFWNCRCACGNICVKRGYHLRNGSTKSCGCLEKENLERLHGTQIKHHQSKAPLYKVWKAMKSRCLNLNDKRYAR